VRISTEVSKGCPLDCGLCPEHRQHTCLALIEVNTACNLDCPVCFANADAGFNLTVPEVEAMLDRLVELEGIRRSSSSRAASRRFTRTCSR
jgi:uncharacterized radical SAM superfamily Fe-S cluster-containing enzyme